ncbi:Rab3 Gtpase-Activating Protein Non-Catalytic Subunit [Manis pentadactyla]|nr:Rab3 Gtpase-Activating Protein Non-Catalytic Subunit [Manis pentadactyla]
MRSTRLGPALILTNPASTISSFWVTRPAPSCPPVVGSGEKQLQTNLYKKNILLVAKDHFEVNLSVLQTYNSEIPVSANTAIVVSAVDSLPRHVFSQDFQDQAIPGQETKAESSHSPVDSDENWFSNFIKQYFSLSAVPGIMHFSTKQFKNLQDVFDKALLDALELLELTKSCRRNCPLLVP